MARAPPVHLEHFPWVGASRLAQAASQDTPVQIAPPFSVGLERGLLCWLWLARVVALERILPPWEPRLLQLAPAVRQVVVVSNSLPLQPVLTFCFLGTFSATAGAISVGTCLTCMNGYSDTAAASCLPCPAGYSCSAGFQTACGVGKWSGIGDDTCTLCGSGTFSVDLQASSINTCLACPVGKYSSPVGAAWCEFCGGGYYSAAVGATSQDTCTPCAIGKYSQIINAASVDTCLDCEPGSYSATAGTQICTPCGAGRYSVTPGKLIDLILHVMKSHSAFFRSKLRC
jgi:hypothetical protein